jgi:DNA transformation protein
MPVSAKYRADIEELLGAVLPIHVKSMFGGLGIYFGAHFFALVDDDVLYFKVNDETRPAFEAHGMGPFRPFPDKDVAMSGYYQVPTEVLTDVGRLREWAKRAVAVAQQSKKPKRSPKPKPRRKK